MKKTALLRWILPWSRPVFVVEAGWSPLRKRLRRAPDTQV
jgi:hypothetical protein